MWPGQAYLVGDTASGHTTPYSEIIVPQQPMFNLGVQGSKDLLGGGDTYYLEINAPGANVYEIEQAVNRVLAASGRQAEARMRA